MSPEMIFFDNEPFEDERPPAANFEANYYLNHQEEVQALERYILHGDWLGKKR